MKWHLYVVRCKDGSLYCGITTNVKRRLIEHNTSRKGAKYTRSHRPVVLVWKSPGVTRSKAAKAEANFKSYTKAEKERFIVASMKLMQARESL